MGAIRDFLRRALGVSPVVRYVEGLPNRRVKGGVGAPSAAAVGAYFEALRDSPDRMPVVRAPLASSGVAVLGYGGRVQLSALSRALYDNGGFVGYAVNQLAHYSTPVVPQSEAADMAWRARAEEWFADWCKRCDFLGRSEVGFYTLQTTVSQLMDLDGDVGALITAEVGFPQVQLVEGWQIGSATRAAQKGLVDGVRLDAKGRVVAYEVAIDGGVLPVPASQMTLVRELAAGATYRGLSPLRRGMNDIRDARDIQHFEKIAVKFLAASPGMIEGGALDEDHGYSVGDDPASAERPPVSPDANGATAEASGVSRADMLGGDIPVLPEGKKFVPVAPNRPNGTFGEFQDTLISWFAAGLDIPPAFFLDQKLTGPNQRAVNAKAQRKFDARQAAIGRWVEWVWVRVIGWAIENGELPATDGWWRVSIQGPAEFTIDAGREAQQERDDHAKGLTTRRSSYQGRGKDWVRETDQVAVEWDYCLGKAKELSGKWGIPIEVALSFFGAAPTGSPPANAQQQGNQSNDQQNGGQNA